MQDLRRTAGLQTCGTSQSLYLVLLAQPLGQDRGKGGLLLTRAPQKVTTYLLRLCHINSRSESFVFKNVIPYENRSDFASQRILSPFEGSD